MMWYVGIYIARPHHGLSTMQTAFSVWLLFDAIVLSRGKHGLTKNYNTAMFSTKTHHYMHRLTASKKPFFRSHCRKPTPHWRLTSVYFSADRYSYLFVLLISGIECECSSATVTTERSRRRSDVNNRRKVQTSND